MNNKLAVPELQIRPWPVGLAADRRGGERSERAGSCFQIDLPFGEVLIIGDFDEGATPLTSRR